jgi:hypothetical protein
MRAVLRTLAQCHSQNILHRDIKPGAAAQRRRAASAAAPPVRCAAVPADEHCVHL